MVPTLIKLSTINALMKAGSTFQRPDIDKHYFKKVMITAILLLVTYLCLWTVIDIPRPIKEYRSSLESNVVTEHIGCASKSNSWRIVSFSFEALLLLATTVLTYFCRGVIEELNESKSLSFMVYSHFLFMCMRLMIFFFTTSGMMPNALFNNIISILISLDTLAAVFIYFFPKFYDIITTAQYVRSEREVGIHMKTNRSSVVRASSIEFPSRASMSGNLSETRIRHIHGLRIPAGKCNFAILKNER